VKKITFGKAKVSRRNFIVGTAAAAGGGLALGLHLPFGVRSARAQGAAGTEVNAWVVIKPDDTCVIRIARSEMGQGSFQAVPQIIAEELEVNLDQVNILFAPGDQKKYGSQITGGSSTVRSAWKQLLLTGATAREMLIEAMIQNLQLQLNVLNQQLNIINQIKQSKSKNHEKNTLHIYVGYPVFG